MKLLLDGYSTDPSVAVGAWVLLQPNEEEQAEGTVGNGGQNSQSGGSEAGVERAAVRPSERALTPNARNVEFQARLVVLTAVQYHRT